MEYVWGKCGQKGKRDMMTDRGKDKQFRHETSNQQVDDIKYI